MIANFNIFLSVGIFLLFIVSNYALPQEKQYPLKLQPELDNINVVDYLKNSRLVDLQVKCVVHNGPCDSVGRWIKPRVAAALLGECIKCTPKQEIAMRQIIEFLQEKRPKEYMLGVVKYLNQAGISVPESKS